MESSGLFFDKREEGSFTIGYEDYNVELFGGDDIEVTYYLDKDNYKIFKKKIRFEGRRGYRNKIEKSLRPKF